MFYVWYVSTEKESRDLLPHKGEDEGLRDKEETNKTSFTTVALCVNANSYKKKNKRRPHKRGIEDGFHHQNNQHRQFEMAVEEEKCGGNQYRQLEAGDICSGVTN
ncbi:hypothetical protein IGI04_026518 [Brassica rapa subsp. trilocularis]|uniref:Uncharacterized protein n=1 Tax=Brassica rapa subsp. trilocularis TaxID=1813537 RepID=A0ABQ7KWU8_BRACM|nr:hypothetical protein IGI04_026518 [Brassica rapa subsp. trilocularis]